MKIECSIDKIKNAPIVIHIYPDPFSDVSTIEINSQEKMDHVTFIMYDVLGNEVHFEILSNLIDAHSIDLSKLQNGIYFLHINNSSTQKLIIQK